MAPFTGSYLTIPPEPLPLHEDPRVVSTQLATETTSPFHMDKGEVALKPSLYSFVFSHSPTHLRAPKCRAPKCTNGKGNQGSFCLILVNDDHWTWWRVIYPILNLFISFNVNSNHQFCTAFKQVTSKLVGLLGLGDYLYPEPVKRAEDLIIRNIVIYLQL